ncbi:MAG: lactonase family protein [Bacteroidia bacterium]|nr:lactonase family protein [Bacteroidia bacterium]
MFRILLPILLLLVAACTPQAEVPSLRHEYIYAGTYSVRGSEGVYVLEFQRDSNRLEIIQTAKTPESPSFLEVSPDGRFLYSTNRAGLDTTTKFGSVSAFAINPADGKLSLINEVSAYGIGPCHIQFSEDAKMLYLSHYSSGSLSVLSVEENGAVGPLADSLTHTGRSVDTVRQNEPHTHSAQPVPGTPYFMVADLGLDKLLIYEMKNGKITPAPLPFVATEPGTGPRHFAFHPFSQRLYVGEELTSSVSVHEFDANAGSSMQIQRLSTLPDTFSRRNSVADIHFSPDGRFLYVSNRGHNSLAIYSVEDETGKLTLVGFQETMGKIPRNFLMDPLGEFVFVAHQETDNIVGFRRDTQTGKLTPAGIDVNIPSPVCLKLLVL